MQTASENYNTKWPALATIWIGGMVSIPSLLIGSTLIGSHDFITALIAGLLGLGFVALFMCFLSIPAVQHRMNTVQLTKSSFGNKGGPILIGVIIGVATIGWFGVQTNIAGASFSKIAGQAFGINLPEYISSLFWGVIMLVTAVYGFKIMKILNIIAVPAIVLLLIYGLYISFQQKSFSDVLSYDPPTSSSLLSAIGLAIGFCAVGGVISPDINRFGQTPKDAILGSLLGLLPAGFILLSVGAILAVLRNTHDITEIFSTLGYPILALSILILATWTTNVVNAYSGGLAINQLFNQDDSQRARSTLIAGSIGTLAAIAGILNYFVGFLVILTAMIPPIAGVIIADVWLSKSYKSEPLDQFNISGFVAWLGGTGVMFLVQDPVKNILGLFVAGGLYWILKKMMNNDD